jgi:hypothetical protein
MQNPFWSLEAVPWKVTPRQRRRVSLRLVAVVALRPLMLREVLQVHWTLSSHLAVSRQVVRYFSF